jgi:GDP-D-mannose dehydratase
VASIERNFWRGRRVLVTGHTGFKGGWLSTWLLDMGAQVSGFALEPETKVSFFSLCRLDQRMLSIIGDVRDLACLRQTMEACQPEMVFHLAAQFLVPMFQEKPQVREELDRWRLLSHLISARSNLSPVTMTPPKPACWLD